MLSRTLHRSSCPRVQWKVASGALGAVGLDESTIEDHGKGWLERGGDGRFENGMNMVNIED